MYSIDVTDVTRLNCVFEQNDVLIPRIFALIAKRYCIKISFKKIEFHYIHRGGGGSIFLKPELSSIKMVNSTGDKSQVRCLITTEGGGGGSGHISLSYK